MANSDFTFKITSIQFGRNDGTTVNIHFAGDDKRREINMNGFVPVEFTEYAATGGSLDKMAELVMTKVEARFRGEDTEETEEDGEAE